MQRAGCAAGKAWSRTLPNNGRWPSRFLRRTSTMFHALVANLPAGVFFMQGPMGRPILRQQPRPPTTRSARRPFRRPGPFHGVLSPFPLRRVALSGRRSGHLSRASQRRRRHEGRYCCPPARRQACAARRLVVAGAPRRRRPSGSRRLGARGSDACSARPRRRAAQREAVCGPSWKRWPRAWWFMTAGGLWSIVTRPLAPLSADRRNGCVVCRFWRTVGPA